MGSVHSAGYVSNETSQKYDTVYPDKDSVTTIKEIRGGHSACPVFFLVDKWLFIIRSRQALFKKRLRDSRSKTT